jgi:glucokinase
MMDAPYPRLLADVGGTNARLAWQVHRDAPLSHVATVLCADHATLLAAIQRHLGVHGLPPPGACGIGIATPVTGDAVTMTNHHWSFSVSELRRQLGTQLLVVVNDFTATALALSELPAAHLRPLGGGEPVRSAPKAVLGSGTGFGVSALLQPSARQPLAISGEGGHVTLSAQDADEAMVIDRLRQRFGHASVERALSGPGLVNLYEAIASIDGSPVHTLAPSDVIDRARRGDDSSCRRALDMFCALLGAVAGNVALTFGARGGVYIAGGIAPRIADDLHASRFRSRFESKGRFAGYLSSIPVYLIGSDVSPALLGASRALDLEEEAAAAGAARAVP